MGERVGGWVRKCVCMGMGVSVTVCKGELQSVGVYRNQAANQQHTRLLLDRSETEQDDICRTN